MIRPIGGAARGRAGITLTEILISILIMGVGMISLATLFPLGLTRLRAAAKLNRSALLTETIASDVPNRNLLSSQSFVATWYGPSVLSSPFNPLTSDPLDATAAATNPGQTGGAPPPANMAVAAQLSGFTAGPGSPFCYDPLWRHLANVPPFSGIGTASLVSNEARFANGEGVVRTDPDGNPPSAHGLQRLTNLPVQNNWPPFATQDVTTTAGQVQTASWNTLLGTVFASQDDPVLQAFSASPSLAQGKGSPLVPDLSSGGPQNDWSYTWMFTGRQTDVSNPAYVDGDIVVLQNRPFGYEALNNTPASNSYTPKNVATGEAVVEAIFGYAPKAASNTNTYYYDPSPTSRTVVLRWPASVPDPDVRVGGWIADVTYERVPTTWTTRFGPTAPTTGDTSPFFPAYQGQRCLWYRVAKKTDAVAEAGGNLFEKKGVAYRQMVVTTATPLRAKTLLTSSPADGSAPYAPVNVNAALVMPSVVNVFSQVFYSR